MYKYRINALLKESPVKIKTQVRVIAEKLGLSSEMLNKIRAYKLGESRAANSDQLLIIAEHFNVTVDDLLNKPEKNNNTFSIAA